MKPRLYYDNYRRAYYLQWDADSDHIGRQEPVFERTREYIESLEAENAKLHEEVEQWHRLTAGIELPEYPITQFQPKDLERENAKLRKLVLDVHALHWSGLDCTECPWIGECDTDGGCPWLGIMRDHMADLGIEVPR